MDAPTPLSVATLALSNYSGRYDNLDNMTVNQAVCQIVQELDEDLIVTVDLLTRTSPKLSLIKYFERVQYLSNFEYYEVSKALKELIRLQKLNQIL